jgi:hypothetical protein
VPKVAYVFCVGFQGFYNVFGCGYALKKKKETAVQDSPVPFVGKKQKEEREGAGGAPPFVSFVDKKRIKRLLFFLFFLKKIGRTPLQRVSLSFQPLAIGDRTMSPKHGSCTLGAPHPPTPQDPRFALCRCSSSDSDMLQLA